MIYSYSETGESANQDRTISAIVDTDSESFKSRIAWIRQKAGNIAPPEVTFHVVQSPGDPTPNTVGTLIWRTADTQISTDCYLTWRSPEVTLAALDTHFRLGLQGVEHMKYADPTPPAPVEDWKTPGAPIGPPLPAYAGFFSTAWGGQPEGYIWAAPSGSRYQLTRIGNGLFSMPAWKKL
jgi:hypothetical protein